MVKSILVTLPEDLHYKVKQKCRYYEYSFQNLISALLLKFVEGDLDKILNLPTDDE
jgi:hypothetical protein